jgi:hypothetical protein
MPAAQAHDAKASIGTTGIPGSEEADIHASSFGAAHDAVASASNSPTATFGDQTGYVDQTGSTESRIRVSSATSGDDGAALELAILCDLSAAGSCQIKGVIYADSAGTPGALLAVSDERTVTNAGTMAWITCPFSGANQVAIASGTSYWIGVAHPDPGAISLRLARGAVSNATKQNADASYADGPLNPYGAVTSQALGPIACYVTLGPASGNKTVFPTNTQAAGTAHQASVTTSGASSVTAFNTLGVFRGTNPASIVAYETVINRTLPGPIVDFTGGSGTGGTAWATRRGQINSFLNTWSNMVVTQGYELVISLVPWPVSLGAQLAAMASGDYDAEYTADAVSLRDRGYTASNCYIRPMWEFNGSFYPHTINSGAAPAGGYSNGVNAVANYITGWRRMVDRMRAVIPGLRFDWCALRLQLTPAVVESAYPGDAYVDYIGLDAYNWRSSTDDLDLRWTRLVQGGTTVGASVGLQWHEDFATAHGKKMTFAEWGVTRRPTGTPAVITNSETPVSDGGDNDPTYVGNFADWLDRLGSLNKLKDHANFNFDAKDAWHQMHTVGTDAPNYSFFGPTRTVFDARFKA